MNRLFKNDILYCEGRTRPYFRGKFHLLSCVTIFPSFIYYLWLKKSYSYGFLACFINISIVYVAHIISSVYHVVQLSLRHEIIIQKLDFIALNWGIGSCFYPIYALFPNGIYSFMCINTVCVYNSYTIFKSNYKVYQCINLLLMQVPVSYYLYTYMSEYELYCFLSSILFLLGSGGIFISEVSFKNIGYFELYHCLLITGVVMICTVNYSIACRIII